MSVGFIKRVISELKRYQDEDPSMDMSDDSVIRTWLIYQLYKMVNYLIVKEIEGRTIPHDWETDTDLLTLLSTYNPKSQNAIANARDWLLKLQIIAESRPRNMSEAVMLEVIMELERYPVVNPSNDTDVEMNLKEVINELRMMLDLLRGKESGERSSLQYLIADFAEMTQLSTNPTTQRAIGYARDWLSFLENYMTEFGFDEERRLDRDATQFIGAEIFKDLQKQLDHGGMWTCLNLSSGKSMKDVLVDMIVKSMAEEGLITEVPSCYTRLILQFSSYGFPRNMWPAIILWAIEQLHWFKATTETYSKETAEEMLKELEDVVSGLSREVEPEGLSWLNYLLADYAEMAQVIADLTVNTDDPLIKRQLEIGVYWLRKIAKRRPEFVDRPQSVGVGEEGVVVGLEKDVQLISRAVLNEESGVKVILIKGMVGSGKTTLARQVYNHASVVGKFKGRAAWISLSSDTSANEVLVELIHKFGDSSLLEGIMDNQSLLRMLCRYLEGMPFFIVLDNRSKQMPLHSIFHALSLIGNGGMLLLTSRYDCTCLYSYVYYTHEMKALDLDKSWQLFTNTIYRFISNENKFSKELERKGREMLKKCWGLPLAIIDVARQKATQRLSGIEWEALFDSIDLSESLKKLEPMYHKLDEELKPYFLHLSLFKENAIMREEKLEQIWAASGFEREPCTMIEKPCGSLDRESIINLVNSPLFSKTRKYRLNPLLHMISMEKAQKEIGLEIIRSNGNSRPSQNPCHRVIHCGREKFNHSTDQDGEHLISLIFHGGGSYLDNACSSYWESFEKVKILDMEDFGVKTLSKTTGTMTDLRYLGLRNNYLTNIPHSLGGLKQLEVLDIAQNFLVEVPDIIWKIHSLRHLYMSDVVCSEPLKINIWKLTTLKYVSIYDWVFDDVRGTLTRLHLLGIEDIDENADVSKFFTSLEIVSVLEVLCIVLRGFRFRSMPCLDKMDLVLIHTPRKLKLNGRLARLPKTRRSLHYIRELVLVNTCLDEDPMSVLQEMPNLDSLKLRNAYTGREMVIKSNGFPNLYVLNINELWNRRNIQVGEGAMPELHQLEIKNCPHLETLPHEIGSMGHLWKFTMLTTRHIATKIKASGLISKILEVDISP